jgi:acetyl esterase/lipase
MFVIAYLFAGICLLMGLSLFPRFKPPFSFSFVLLPLVTGATSPIMAVLGLLGAGLGWFYQAPLAVAAGLTGAGIMGWYVFGVTRPQPGFVLAFGENWLNKIPQEAAAKLLPKRWSFGLPKTPEPKLAQNIPFWTFSGTGRVLLCDIWQPPVGVAPSGLMFVYFHGSAWYLFDKDCGTRPLFRQLAAQGHVIMDVAYRLCPEVDIYEMVGDVKRAIAWAKANAARYGADPARVVLGGASAGGHLALLAAYTPEHHQLTPSDLHGQDLSVRAVVSYYGPTDLRACYEHLNQKRLVNLPRVAVGQPGSAEIKKEFKDAGRLDMLLGGHLHETPEMYTLASPVTHVQTGCPPTLLIQGEPDVITPVAATRELYRRLTACGVPSVNIVYPLTNHAFDLLLPSISPVSQAALYELERFLALMV